MGNANTTIDRNDIGEAAGLKGVTMPKIGEKGGNN